MSAQTRGNNPISGHYLSEGDRKDLKLASSELQSKLDLLHKVSLHYDFLIPPPPISSNFDRQEAINKLARRTLHPAIYRNTPSHGFNSHSHFAVHNFLAFNHGFLSEVLDYLDFKINWGLIDLNDRIYGPGVPDNLDYVETMYNGREGLRVFLKWIGGWDWVSKETSRDTPKAWIMVDALMPALKLIKKGIMDCQMWIDQAEHFDYPHDELRADVDRILKKCGMDFGRDEREEGGDSRRKERFETGEREVPNYRQEERWDRRSWSRSDTSESGDDGSRFDDAQYYERQQGSDPEERSASSHSSHSDRAAWRFAQQLAKEDRALDEHRRMKAQKIIDERDQLCADTSLPCASPARKDSLSFSGQRSSDIPKTANLQNSDEDHLTVDIWENPALKEEARKMQTLRDRLAQEKAGIQKLADGNEHAEMLAETQNNIRSDTTQHTQARAAATRQKASAHSARPFSTGDDRTWVTEDSDKGQADFDIFRDLPPDHQKLRQKAIDERKLALEAQRQALYIKNLAQGILDRERLLQTEPITHEPNADSLRNSATAGSRILDSKKSRQEHSKFRHDTAEGLSLQGRLADEVGTWGWEAEDYSAYGQVIPGFEAHVETQLNPMLQDPKIAVKDQVDNLHHSEEAKVSARCESDSVSRAEGDKNSVGSLPPLPLSEVEEFRSGKKKVPRLYVFKSSSSEKDDGNGPAFKFTSSPPLTQSLPAYSSPKSSDCVGPRIFTSSIMQLPTAPLCSLPAKDDGKPSDLKLNASPSALNGGHFPPAAIGSPPSSPPHIPKPQYTARPPLSSPSISKTSPLFPESTFPLHIEEQQVAMSRMSSSTSEAIASPQATTQPLTPEEEARRDRARKKKSDKKKRQKAARKAAAAALAAEEGETKDKGADTAKAAIETCTAEIAQFVDTGKGKKRKIKKQQDIAKIAAASVGPLARMWGKDREVLGFAGREV